MLYFGIFPSLVRFYLNLPQFGRVTSSVNHFSFQNNRISGQNLPRTPTVVITVFKRIHHHRFNDSIALPLAISLMSLSNRCLDPSFELLHSLSSHDPIPHPSWKSLGPDFQSLMRGFAKWNSSGEDCAPSSPSCLSSCVLGGTCQSCNSNTWICRWTPETMLCLHHLPALQKLPNRLHPKPIAKTDFEA